MDTGRPGKEVEVSATDGSVNCHQADTPHAATVAENGISDSESSNTVVHFTLDSGEAGDVILDAGDRRFSCHKKVLQHHSPYFKAMFKSGMKESHSEIISLGDVNSKYLQCLLDYFYTGNLGLTELNVQGVAEVSSLLQVSGALDHCCQLLLTIIDDDLCFSLMWLADFLMLEEVYDRSRRHALWHFHGVSQTEDFFLASPAKLVNYLQDPHLNIDSEVDVFRAAAEWYSTQEKPCDVTDLTAFFGRLVNFHLMTNEEVALLKDLVVVEKEQTLKSFVASLSPDIITRLRKETSSRTRTSPRDGHILCVGAHQCSLAGCKEGCRLVKHETAPLEVLGFEPDGCCLEPFASLSDHYPELALDSGYRVCAIGHLLYVVGGEASLGQTGGWLTTIWCLDTLHQSWHDAGSLQQVRRHHGMCAHGSTLFLIGGIGRFRCRLQSVESFNTDSGEWNQLPDMLHQETAPAVTQHRGNIYVFKNYAQVFHIPTSTWTFLELSPPVPGLPLFAHPHPTTTNGILVSCFNSQSLWLVDVDRLQRQLVLNFQTEGGGGVFHRGRVFHFQLHDAEFGVSRDTQVESYSTADMSWSVTGVLPCTVFSSHFVTVPRFPRYMPSSQNQLC